MLCTWDNFYSIHHLRPATSRSVVSGTVHTSRKHFPTSLKPNQGENNTQGYCEFLYHRELTATRWHENKDIYALSTVYGDSPTKLWWQGLPGDYYGRQIHGWCRPCRPGHVLVLCWDKDHEVVEEGVLKKARSGRQLYSVIFSW